MTVTSFLYCAPPRKFQFQARARSGRITVSRGLIRSGSPVFRFHSRDFRLLAFHLYQDRRDAAAGPLGGIAQTTRKKFGLQYVRNRRESPVTPPGGNPPGKYTLDLMPAEEPRIYAGWR